MKVSAGFKSETSGGLGIMTSIGESEISAGVKTSIETSNTHLSEASIGYGRDNDCALSRLESKAPGNPTTLPVI